MEIVLTQSVITISSMLDIFTKLGIIYVKERICLSQFINSNRKYNHLSLSLHYHYPPHQLIAASGSVPIPRPNTLIVTTAVTVTITTTFTLFASQPFSIVLAWPTSFP